MWPSGGQWYTNEVTGQPQESNDVSENIVQTLLELWLAQCCDHFPREPVLVPNHPLQKGEEPFPNNNLPWHSCTPFPRVLSLVIREEISACLPLLHELPLWGCPHGVLLCVRSKTHGTAVSSLWKEPRKSKVMTSEIICMWNCKWKFLSMYHGITESNRVGKTSATESSLCLNTTISSRQQHWVPHPVFP